MNSADILNWARDRIRSMLAPRSTKRLVEQTYGGKTGRFECYQNHGVLIPIVLGVTSEAIASAIRGGGYEAHEAAMLGSLIQTDEVILEIGAGCGFISTVCAKNPYTRSVTCIEANPGLIELIKLTHRINGVAPIVHNELLAEQDGEATFYVHQDFWASGKHDFLGSPIKVPATSFQRRLNEVRPTMLIIDIEGGEVDLFDHVDLTGVRKIMLEVHQPTIGRRGMKKVFDVLSAQNFHYDMWHSTYSVVTFSHVDRM